MSDPNKWTRQKNHRIATSIATEMPPIPDFQTDLNKEFIATDLEVSTVTPTSVVITWITRRRSKLWQLVPAPVGTNTRLFLGTNNRDLKLVHEDSTPRAFHRVHIRGLEPGRRYFFSCESSGITPLPALHVTKKPGSFERTYSFTTLLPPPGKYLTSIALANDIHIGEVRQGINLGPLFPTSVSASHDKKYPETMFTSMLEELGKRGSPYLCLAGDITNSGKQAEAVRFRDLVDGYGTQNDDWMAVRGNHDFPKHDDPFGSRIAVFQKMQLADHPSGLRIIGIDTTYKSGGGRICADQFTQISDVLRNAPDRPTLSMSHHPVTKDSVNSWPAGQTFMLRKRDRLELQKLHVKAPGVFLHFSGHTHRMRRNKPDLFGAHTEYLENAAVAAYPGGYSLLHLYEGGYILNFWRTSTPRALDWTYRSRWQMMGIGPHLTVGTVDDRNHVVFADLSGLEPYGEIPEELRV